MSYSYREPEEPPTCECKYDEVYDRMDRDDCLFHVDMAEDPNPGELSTVERKPVSSERLQNIDMDNKIARR